MSQPIDLTLENFSEVMQGELPVIIDFWAPWCGPCLQFGPFFAQVAPQFSDRVVFAKVNTQNETVLGQRYAIRSIPTVAVFHKDREFARFSGVMSPLQLHQWLERVLEDIANTPDEPAPKAEAKAVDPRVNWGFKY